MILLDTSGVLAALDRSSQRHEECAAALSVSSAPRLLSPFVLAEIDYLVSKRVGPHAQALPLEDVVAGAYQLEPFGADDIARALAVMRRFEDLAVGLADASIVVLADRHGCADVLTLDERHFRTLRHGGNQQFRLLPMDG